MVGAPFESIAPYMARTFRESEKENLYLLIAVDYSTKWPEIFVISNHEASSVAVALVTNFFSHFGVPRKLQSDQSWNFEPRLMQEVLQHLGICKTRTTPLYPL
jgi:hypothetical protein